MVWGPGNTTYFSRYHTRIYQSSIFERWEKVNTRKSNCTLPSKVLLISISLHTIMSTTEITRTNDDYTVGWICALQAELAASQAMLDEEHPDLLQDENDTNTYTLGRIGQHNVVLACLPKVRFGLMVGVGGGAPSNPRDDPRQDIRLGDVIVSNPEDSYGKEECIYLIKSKLTKRTGGVLQYDFGKTIEDGKFIQTGSLNKPPAVLMTGVAKLQALHLRKGNAIRAHVNSMLESNPMMQQDFNYRNPEDDQLFQADYDHMGSDEDCKNCDEKRLVQRKPRTNVPVIHYGLIGSANQMIRHGVTREKLRQETGIICFEMEAAGLMDNFPCIVIRGICNYSDTHAHRNWQPYAAATAAAYVKELLGVIPPVQVKRMPIAADAVKVSPLHFPAHCKWC
jgi:nucleoside phosphorylase